MLEVDDEACPSIQIHARNRRKTPLNSRMKMRQKYCENHEKEKRSIQYGDEIHAQRSAILIESNVYKVWKLPQHPPTLWRIGGISHFLSFPHLHYEVHPHISKSNHG
jgi:hypothetical protein